MYYIIYNGQQVGPMDAHQLRYYGLNEQSDVREEGSTLWVKAFTIPALMAVMSHATPPPYTASDPIMDTGRSGKSRLVAALLAFFLGYLGVHYFYLGKVSGGIICILLTIITCGVWEIVSLIQGVIFLLMSQQEFERKFVFTPATFPLF